MGGGGGGGGNDKRSVNAELNLVPYIDLLSTLICFLLMTAVWQQISALTTNGSNASASESAGPPPDPNRVDLGVAVFLDRIEATAGKNMQPIPHIAGEPNYDRLLQVLASWKQQWPDRKDVTLHSDSQAPYKFLIRTMDTLVEAEFEDVGVNTQ